VGYFRQTELEADILSVSLLANAGYDPKIAVLFWQDFGPSHAGSVLRSRTHPGWKTRVSVIEREIAALGADLPHLPAIIAARDRPLDGKWQDLLTEEGVFSGG
jgi:predicted Zn-dependent protease